MMLNTPVLQRARDFFQQGLLKEALAETIAYQTESQSSEQTAELYRYLKEITIPQLEALGFSVEQYDNSVKDGLPFIIAERIEDQALPTILLYGHGDVVFGDDANWDEGLTPWALIEKDERWYGRGTADNKGQHIINFSALAIVLKEKGVLGFNCKILFEMGEEAASPGLAAIAEQYKEKLSADLFIASDGPRLHAESPTLFLGSRGCANIRLSVQARDKAYHSGNWGGLLSNPAIELAHAIALIVDQQGKILVPDLRPPALTDAMQSILATVEPSRTATDPAIDPNWGEPELTAAEKLFGWNNFEILSFITGNPAQPMNAIPPSAVAVCQLRFVVGTPVDKMVTSLEEHFKAHGLPMVKVESLGGIPATRFDPQDQLVQWALAKMSEVTQKVPTLLPNLGGSLPNDVFADILGLPTLWIPHSYPACGQHGPNEHMLPTIALEGLEIMAHLFDVFGTEGKTLIQQRAQNQ